MRITMRASIRFDRSILENNDHVDSKLFLYTHIYTHTQYIYLSINLISKIRRMLFRYDHQRNFWTMDTYMYIKYTFEEERALFLFPTISMNIYWTGESAKFASWIV